MATRELDLDHFERRLLEERDQTLESIRQAEMEEEEGQRESSGELSRIPTHPADAASDTQEAEKDLANINRESEQLARIDEALRLLREDPESYGVCGTCGRPIAQKRLDLVPWTRVCAEHAASDEGRPAGETG